MHVQAKYRPWLIEGNPVLDGTVLMGKSIGRCTGAGNLTFVLLS